MVIWKYDKPTSLKWFNKTQFIPVDYYSQKKTKTSWMDGEIKKFVLTTKFSIEQYKSYKLIYSSSHLYPVYSSSHLYPVYSSLQIPSSIHVPYTLLFIPSNNLWNTFYAPCTLSDSPFICTVAIGHELCPLFGEQRCLYFRRFKIYCVNTKSDQGQVICPLYTGCQVFGVSLTRG